MSEPVQHFFESQRLRLAYWAWGDEANPPLVMVHGGRDHARGWDPLAAVFERARARGVTLPLGPTPPREGTS